MAAATSGIKGDVFRKKREELGLSLRDVEERTGVNRSTLSNLENGAAVPDGANMIALMKFFKLVPADIT